MASVFCGRAAGQTRPSSEPVEPAATTQGGGEDRVQQLFAYLTKEYSRELGSKDWITRSVAVICLAQFPTDDATKAIVERLGKETHPVGKLIAWQAVMSRANLLSDAQVKAWDAATSRMIKEDLFHGDLRVALLEMLSAKPITSEHRRFVQQLFTKTNSLDSEDVPTLIAMGRAMHAWGDAQLVESVIPAMQNKDSATRAKLVLKSAGADAKLDADAATFEKWWKEGKPSFIKNKPQPDAWKNLRPQFIDPPVDAAKVDPQDKQWKKQLELESLGLNDFDFAIDIDCSLSMGPEIARVKRDLLVMHTALSEVAQKSRVGITAFSTAGETRTVLKLTGAKDEIVSGVKKLELFGKMGEEEWAGGLDLCIKGNDWRPANERSRRVIVMVTDEKMTPEQQEKIAPIVKQASAAGFKLYALLVFPPSAQADPFTESTNRAEKAATTLPTVIGRSGDVIPERTVERVIGVYKNFTEMTGGKTIFALRPTGALGLGEPTKRADHLPRHVATVDAGEIAPVYPDGGPTAHLLTVVLADAINPQYAERVEPLVQILAAHSQHVAWVPEARPK